MGGGIAIHIAWPIRASTSWTVTARAAGQTPPVRKMLHLGVPVGAGIDTRVASYNPFVSLSWMVTGERLAAFRYIPTKIASEP